MIDPATVPVNSVVWPQARRIIRSLYPVVDLFEEIADPADWPLLIAAEQKTNPRLMESIGNIDLVPPDRRVSGPGSTYLMAPFTHVSRDRPSRFSDGRYGVLYVAERFEAALLETVYHHGRFMGRTREPAGWTSQFREIVLDVDATLHDIRQGDDAAVCDRDDYAAGQSLAATLRAAGSDGLAYRSVRAAGLDCAALFYPDGAAHAVQGRHLDYHWNGRSVDFYRDAGSGQVFRIG